MSFNYTNRLGGMVNSIDHIKSHRDKILQNEFNTKLQQLEQKAKEENNINQSVNASLGGAGGLFMMGKSASGKIKALRDKFKAFKNAKEELNNKTKPITERTQKYFDSLKDNETLQDNENEINFNENDPFFTGESKLLEPEADFKFGEDDPFFGGESKISEPPRAEVVEAEDITDPEPEPQIDDKPTELPQTFESSSQPAETGTAIEMTPIEAPQTLERIADPVPYVEGSQDLFGAGITTRAPSRLGYFSNLFGQRSGISGALGRKFGETLDSATSRFQSQEPSVQDQINTELQYRQQEVEGNLREYAGEDANIIRNQDGRAVGYLGKRPDPVEIDDKPSQLPETFQDSSQQPESKTSIEMTEVKAKPDLPPKAETSKPDETLNTIEDQPSMKPFSSIPEPEPEPQELGEPIISGGRIAGYRPLDAKGDLPEDMQGRMTDDMIAEQKAKNLASKLASTGAEVEEGAEAGAGVAEGLESATTALGIADFIPLVGEMLLPITIATGLGATIAQAAGGGEQEQKKIQVATNQYGQELQSNPNYQGNYVAQTYSSQRQFE